MNAAGQIIAAAAVEWAEMPIGWTALQSRRGVDLLGLEDPERVDVRRFDDAFAVDTDDMPRFREQIAPAILDWIVWLDEQSGPLTIIFDGVTATDRLRDPDVPTIFVARLVTDDDAFLATAKVAVRLADHLAAMIDA